MAQICQCMFFCFCQWNVTPIIWRGSNLSFFAALYCYCLGFNALLALQMYNFPVLLEVNILLLVWKHELFDII